MAFYDYIYLKKLWYRCKLYMIDIFKVVCFHSSKKLRVNNEKYKL